MRKRLPNGWRRNRNGAVRVDGWNVITNTFTPPGTSTVTVTTPGGKKLTHEVNFNGATFDTVEHFASVEAAVRHVDKRYPR